MTGKKRQSYCLKPPEDDGLYIAEVGPWSADKHHVLRRYIDAFTTAMRAKPWHGLHYIDLFAGAGIERLRGSETLDWGSPLIAAQAPRRFQQLHLCERIDEKFEALAARISRFEQPSQPQLLHGDANVEVARIVPAISEGSLSLAFIDPYGLDCEFATIQKLAERPADLLILFPDHVDILRNWEKTYQDQLESKLDTFLGTPSWRQAIASHAQSGRGAAFARLYREQLRKIGYRHFAHERITDGGRRLYLLIFCSRHEAGAKIWHGIAGTKRGGQRLFPFGE